MDKPICNCGAAIYVTKTRECAYCYRRRLRSADHQAKIAKDKANRLARPARPSGRRQLKVTDLNKPIAYITAHFRLRNWRGKAATYSCVDCGEQAAEWSYDGGSRFEQRGTKSDGKTVAWSTSVLDYSPRCNPCHQRLDRRVDAYELAVPDVRQVGTHPIPSS